MDINKVIEIAKEAGEMFFDRDFEVEHKSSIYDKVTSLDIKIEKFLKERLTSLIDGSGFMGEESRAEDLSSQYVWIVDPIDGTSNFIRDFRMSCLSIALMRDGEIVQGVIYNPYADEMFSAKKDNGAYLNDKKISVSNMPFDKSMLFTSLHPYYKEKAKVMLDFITDIYPQIDDTRRSASAAIDLCNLACGRGDLSFKLKLSPWDYAAALLIITEAGGIVGTIDSDVITYDKPIPIIAANNKKNYDRLYKMIVKHYK